MPLGRKQRNTTFKRTKFKIETTQSTNGKASPEVFQIGENTAGSPHLPPKKIIKLGAYSFSVFPTFNVDISLVLYTVVIIPESIKSMRARFIIFLDLLSSLPSHITTH